MTLQPDPERHPSPIGRRAGTARVRAEVAGYQGENPVMLERIIVAPDVGRFRPLTRGWQSLVTSVIRVEQTIGFVDGFHTSIPVRSPFEGVLAGMLAAPGEHLHQGQPVAWLRPP